MLLVRRVKPRFSIPPEPEYNVMAGSDLNITCVAVGSPMPYVKWVVNNKVCTNTWRLVIKNQNTFESRIIFHTIDILFQEVNPRDGKNPPIGKNVLMLKNIQRSENYTCQAASKLALIENTTQIRVQGKFKIMIDLKIIIHVLIQNQRW